MGQDYTIVSNGRASGKRRQRYRQEASLPLPWSGSIIWVSSSVSTLPSSVDERAEDLLPSSGGYHQLDNIFATNYRADLHGKKGELVGRWSLVSQ